MTRSAFVVMTKYPAPGRVKTRLIPAVTPEQAAALQATFLRHTVRTLNSLPAAEVILCFDPPDAEEPFRQLLATQLPRRFLPQGAGDLGARIASAATALSHRYDRLLFLGVDSPHLTSSAIQAALDLIMPDAISIGPTKDGGFWCLGLAAGMDVHTLLSNVPWSSGQEWRRTMINARSLRYGIRLAVDSWDIDHPADLRRICEDRETAAQHPALLSDLKRILPPHWFC